MLKQFISQYANVIVLLCPYLDRLDQQGDAKQTKFHLYRTLRFCLIENYAEYETFGCKNCTQGYIDLNSS